MDKTAALFDLSGHVACVTGASAGLGRRSAIALANAGAKVIGIARRGEALHDLQSELGADRFAYCVADVAQRDMLDDLVGRIATPFGAPDILVQAAGVNTRQPADDVTDDGWDQTLALNLTAPFFLAKALVHSPQILVLDEPTAGVDIELRQTLWDNVRRLNQETGMTIILTTHYLEEAEKMCDQIAIMNHGKLIAQDSTPNLLAQLDGKTMHIQPEEPVQTLPTHPDMTSSLNKDGSLNIRYSATKTSAEEVFQMLRQNQIAIRDVKTSQADLEDVFLELTKSA